MECRRPTSDECRLFLELAKIAKIEDPESWVKALWVREMDDGGMGSLEIVAATSQHSGSRIVACQAAVQFTDSDGVETIASLNADASGTPFELDVWKTDFSKLRGIPARFRPV